MVIHDKRSEHKDSVVLGSIGIQEHLASRCYSREGIAQRAGLDECYPEQAGNE